MKIYIDTCGWCRPCDEHSDKNVYDEAVAIMRIVRQARRQRRIVVLGSVTLDKEIGENSDGEKLVWVMNLYNDTVSERAVYKKDVFDVLEPIAEAAGVEGWDIYHLCFAEASGAEYLLTTDKKFLRGAAKIGTSTKVINPLHFPIGGIL